MDLNENSDYQLMFARPDVDVDGIITWPSDQHVVGFLYNDDKPHIQFVDPEAAGDQPGDRQGPPGGLPHVTSVSRDGHMLLIHSYSDVEPGVYHALDMTKHELTRSAA